MLTLHFSNRLETLTGRLFELLDRRQPDVFARDEIIVPSMALRRHLSIRRAATAGISANLQFDFLARWLWRQIAQVVPGVAAESPFSAFRLAWQVLAVFEQEDLLANHPRLRIYLEGADAVMRYELALRLGTLFEAYVTYRPDWLQAWERNQQPDDLDSPADGADAAWQADLWRRIRQRQGASGRDPVAAFRLALAEPVKPGLLPAQVHVFALPAMAPLHLGLLRALSEHIDVHLYILNPCREYWADIVSRRELQRLRAQGRDELHEEGHRLLAGWGRQTRAYFRELMDCLDSDAVDEQEYTTNGTETLLARVQDSLLDLKELVPGSVTLTAQDRSIEVHVGHSLMRQLEILQDHLLGLFASADNGSLKPSDIVVAVPDRDAAAPLIEAVFSSAPAARHIPYTITGRTPSVVEPVTRAFLAVLALADARITAIDLEALIQQPVIARRFGFDESDGAELRDWIARCGIRWGLSADHRQRFDLPQDPHHTVEEGLDRLLLSYLLPADPNTPFLDRLLPANGLIDIDADLLGRFADLCAALTAVVSECASPRDAAGWKQWLQRLADRFLEPSDIQLDALRDLLDTVSNLTDTLEQAHLNAPLPLAVIRRALAHQLDETAPGGVPGGGVTFASMSSLRALPFAVVCLVGLDDGAFPRPDRPLDVDLLARHRRQGDRVRREEERNVFLDAILSARQSLYLSYTGRSDRDNASLPPSVLLAELLDVLIPAIATDPADAKSLAAARARLIVEHPLQPFSIEAFSDTGDARRRSHHEGYAQAISTARENPADLRPIVATTAEESDEEDDADDVETGELYPARPLFSAPLPAPNDEHRDVELSELIDFFKNPCRHLLQKRLRITLAKPLAELSIVEPRLLNGLDRHGLTARLLPAALALTDKSRLSGLARAGTELPTGSIGDASLDSRLELLERFAQRWALSAPGHCLAPEIRTLPLSFEGEGWSIRATYSDLRAAGLVRCEPGKLKASHLLEAWLHHLLLASTSDEPRPTVWLTADKTVTLSAPESPQTLLLDLFALYRQGLTRPLHFFPESSLVFLQTDRNLSKAKANFTPSAHAPWNEGSDAAIRLALREFTDPIDEEFIALSERVLSPLLRHLTEDAAL